MLALPDDGDTVGCLCEPLSTTFPDGAVEGVTAVDISVAAEEEKRDVDGEDMWVGVDDGSTVVVSSDSVGVVDSSVAVE